MSGFIYFLRCADFIKIGFSKRPKVRTQLLACANPFPVVVAAVFPGSRDDERRLHQIFAAHREKREWFRSHPDIEEVISRGLPHFDAAVPAPSVASLIDALGGATAFAKIIGRGVSTASEMKRNGSIHVSHWPKVVAAARKSGIGGVDYDLLARLHTGEAAECQ